MSVGIPGVRGDGIYHFPGEGRGEIHNSPNGHRSNALNPNNKAYAAAQGNHQKQMASNVARASGEGGGDRSIGKGDHGMSGKGGGGGSSGKGGGGAKGR